MPGAETHELQSDTVESELTGFLPRMKFDEVAEVALVGCARARLGRRRRHDGGSLLGAADASSLRRDVREDLRCVLRSARRRRGLGRDEPARGTPSPRPITKWTQALGFASSSAPRSRTATGSTSAPSCSSRAR